MQKTESVCIRYLMREMDPSEEIEFEREMMEDENLLIEVESLRKTYQKLGKLPLKEPPAHLVDKIVSEAAQVQQEMLNRSKKWTFYLSRSVAAAAVLILMVSSGVYFFGGTDSDIPGVSPTIVNGVEEVEPWVDRSNMIHFAGTSIQQDNPEPIQQEVEDSYSKLKLVNEQTGFESSNRTIILTSSSN
ncbi:MAG: hypothetical protein ED557_03205 [Balneola sp.]|nr:MAG: hypothetical protein ED557_03205 [Balneola sp.]